MSIQLFSLLKDQFACCVKLLILISDDDKAEAVTHIETVLTELGNSFEAKDYVEPDEQNHVEDLDTEQYHTEIDIKQEEEEKEDEFVELDLGKQLENGDDVEYNQEKVITTDISVKDETMEQDIEEYSYDTVINAQHQKATFRRIMFESSNTEHSAKRSMTF